MPTSVENCALQCAAGGQEQGYEQVVWQVLDVGQCIALGIYYVFVDLFMHMQHDLNNGLREMSEQTKDNNDGSCAGAELIRQLCFARRLP